ncbi:PspA/IM30 family protein [Polyangium jinanense]|uniref:PspA/IM30 family protein n=1 Tax=Polyangium jinanense TaxID=2829994 RepID=A0A9X3X7P4_9BACT|nr:PspA/IM30 family protein [Polyangium jinanense]MDC3961077.1 PspA/IM30 family protein [Polyangium jinanense]MDC3982846.1 PspA/IM30 family protein [Polyangium jinanense]
MGIFDRMGKVISSNVNALLDKAEDPKKSVDLIVEEMKDQIRAARKELVEAVAAEKVLRKKVDEIDAETTKWERRAELALKAGDESLAREALVQKKRIIAERDRAEALRAEQRAAALNMKRELERMEQKQQELEARKGTIASQLQQAKAGGGAEGLGSRSSTGGAFAEFRRMEDKIEGKVAEVAAARELDDALRSGGMSDMELESKFAQLEGGGTISKDGKPSNPEIDDELAALKKKIRIG